jgi:hypothetical protein
MNSVINPIASQCLLVAQTIEMFPVKVFHVVAHHDMIVIQTPKINEITFHHTLKTTR